MKLTSPRILLSVLPALLLAAVAVSVIWGDNGLLVRHQLKAQLTSAQEELAQLERENEASLRALRTLEKDPVVVERMVADELGWGAPESTIIRFE